MAYIPETSSVVSFQSDPTKLLTHASVSGIVGMGNNSVIAVIQGSVATTIIPVANQSVSGTVGASMIGQVTVVSSLVGGIFPISGSVSAVVTNFPTTQNVSGSVIAQVSSSVLAVVGSVATHIKSGSVIAVLGGNTSVLAIQSGTAITSISGIVDVSGSIFGIVRSSVAGGIFPISGSVAAVITNFPTTQNVSGSVAAFLPGNASIITVVQGSVAVSITPVANQSVSGTVGASVIGHAPVVIVGGSIAASFTPPANQSVSGTVGSSVIGTVPVTQGGTWIASTFGTMSVLGTVPVTQSTTPWTVVSSITGGIFPVSGSVAATITNTSLNVNGSVIAQIASSVLTVTSGTVTANQGTGFGSVAAHIKSGSVIAVLGGNTSVVSLNYVQRNDAIASALGADLTTRLMMGDSAGRTVIKPFTSEDNTIISYVGSVVSTSITLIQASVIGKKNYVTDFWLSNTGATTTLVNFKDGGAATLGQFIAPTGGGMSSPGLAVPMKTAVSQDLVFQAVTATSVLYLTLKGYQAP